jgi:7,8-dihydropterin-6-yl-methyl-4-(beta-D-ribofuranosyl)aminobenzene 5'-phosphate synthase
MKRILAVLLFILCAMPSLAEDVTITILYNNVAYDKNLETGWGFAAFISGLEKNIMFDTGGDGDLLLSNMAKLKIDPGDVAIIVLSHIHGDHVDGLWSVLKRNNTISVYLPRSFPASFKERVMKMSRRVVLVDRPIKVCKGVWSTGELGTYIREQSLVIETVRGIIVMTGCAHPGIVNIARFAKGYFKRDLYLVLGGFHLEGVGEGEIKSIIGELKHLGVKRFSPSHCTGTLAMDLFKQAGGYIHSGCGARIRVR